MLGEDRRVLGWNGGPGSPNRLFHGGYILPGSGGFQTPSRASVLVWQGPRTLALRSPLSPHPASRGAPRVAGSPGELERLPDQPLDARLLSIGRTAQGYVPRVLAGALEQAAFVLELAAAIEEQGRMIREGADADHVGAADGVADELPHRAARAWRPAAVGDLIRLRSRLLDSLDRSLDCRAHVGRNVFEVFGEQDLRRGHHVTRPRSRRGSGRVPSPPPPHRGADRLAKRPTSPL